MKLAGLFLVAAIALMTAIGIRAGMPADAQGSGRFAIDANLDNGVCGPVDGSVSVGQNGTLRVAVCALGVTEAPEALTVHVAYDTAFLTAPEVPDTAGGLDDNPDANAGLTTFGTQTLGDQWDCTTFGVYSPKADDAATPGGDAKINCNANLSNSDRKLHDGAMAVITFQTGTKSGTTQLTILPDTVASYPQATIELEYGCQDPNQSIPCDGASVTVGGAAATPTPVTPTPGPTQAAAATATRVTFDATQAALPNGANTGQAPVEQTQTALQNATPANAETAAAVSSALGSVAATGTALSAAAAVSGKTAAAQATKGTSVDNAAASTNSSGDSGSDSNTGLFAGIGIGAVVVIAAAAGGGYWWYRRRNPTP